MAFDSKYRSPARDWEITSYGDIGAFAGIGVRLSQHSFRSPSLGKTANTLFLEVGLGAGVDFKLPPIEKMNTAIKAYGTATAGSGYKKLICHRAFSVADISGALGDCESGSFVIGDGPKMTRIAARGNGLGPAGSALLFTMAVARTPVPGKKGKTAAGEKGYGASIEASVTAGFFVVQDDNWLESKGRRDMGASKDMIIRNFEPGKM